MLKFNWLKKLYAEHELLHQSHFGQEIHRPKIICFFLYFITLLVFVSILWAAFTDVPERIHANGQIEPEGSLVFVQHFDGGIVNRVSVREGDFVKKGALLLTTKGTGINQDYKSLHKTYINMQLKRERLEALFNGTVPNFKRYTKNSQWIAMQNQVYEKAKNLHLTNIRVLEHQLEQVQSKHKTQWVKAQHYHEELNVTNKIKNMYSALAKQGTAPLEKLYQEERRIIALQRNKDAITIGIKESEHAIKEYQSRILQLKQRFKSGLLESVENLKYEMNKVKEDLRKAGMGVRRQKLRSPVDGIVKSVLFSGTESVIKPGQKVFELVPQNKPLIAVLHINPRDISKIKMGQDVKIKISAFDYLQYGVLHGKFTHISASTFKDLNEQPYFKARVKLESNYYTIDKQKKYIMPGMQVAADFVTKQRSILNYLLKPIYRAFSNSFSEQ